MGEFILKLNGWLARLLPIVLVLLLLGLAIHFMHKTHVKVDSGTINIVGKGVKIDVDKFSTERDRRGNVVQPKIIAGNVTAERDIKKGEVIPINLDLRGAGSKAPESKYRFIVGLDSKGYYNGLSEKLLDLWVLNIQFGLGYGFQNNCIIGIAGIGMPFFSEHWDMLVGYTTNQSVTM